MKYTRHFLWIMMAVGALMAMLSSCIEDDFTTSSSDKLAFNMDTVAFDTVITLQGSATKQMVVYNHSKKQINISSIKVKGLTSKGHFHLNVDGIRGDEFQNVEIRGNDSIFIFIEAYLDEMEQDEPTLLEDELEFVTNGETQHVLLSAWGQDVIRLKGDTISRDTHLTANKPYLIYDTVYVAQGATLTIDAGATLLFHDKAAMRCAGRMQADGTVEEPITFRGDRLDRVVGSYSFDMMSGQWGGIIFTPPTKGNVLQHVIMKGSTIGMHCSGIALDDTTVCALKLVNCVLTNSASTCLVANSCYVQAIGTEFSDAAEEVVYVESGKVRMSQCTFANYYLFAVPSLPVVNVFDMAFIDGTVTKVSAGFDNCIFYGVTEDSSILNVAKLIQYEENGKIMWKQDNTLDIDNYNVYVRYCLFRKDGSNNSHFINCVWMADPCFLTDRDNYIFDYRLGNESDAIGRGNIDLCPEEARYDRYGNDRFMTDDIDLGAYVWVPVPEEE